MPPVPTPLPEPAGGLLDAYLAHLAAGERGNRTYVTFARSFLARWPDPQAWAAEPLALRLGANRHTRPLLTFLMLHGHLQPGYDYLLERKLPALLRELPTSPLGPQIDHFLAAAGELGYASRARLGMASQVAARLLIQTGRALTALTEADLAAFAAAVTEREQRHRRAFKHYRTAVYATRAVLYHLGAHVEPAAKDTPGRWSWEQRFDGAAPAIRTPMVAYLECCGGTRARSTVRGIASRLAHFGRFLAAIDPGWPRWPTSTASATSSHGCTRSPRPATPAWARRCRPPSGAAASSPSGGCWPTSPSGAGPKPQRGG